MQYRNTELKIDQLVNYCNENKINLSPAFQRGHVWNLSDRKDLLKNILAKKPIPAIFLYKEAAGTKYSYNILDGKQRLESIILFINSARQDLSIPKWKEYFFRSASASHANFKVETENIFKSFDELDDSAIRDFREYSIPTIEISLDESANLDEIISLFVDINQQGVAVSRFNIVKAMCKSSRLLNSAFGLIALKQKRGKDVFYKLKKNPITHCFGNLYEIRRIKENNYKVDRMWEKLIDVTLCLIKNQHHKPGEVFKGFLSQKTESDVSIPERETKMLRDTCIFLNDVSKDVGDINNPLFSEYTHFYSALTAIARNSLVKRENRPEMKRKLIKWCEILEKKRLPGWKQSIQTSFKQYREASLRQTSDPSHKNIRERQFINILNVLN